MARQLWLLRHAEAESHGTRADSERRLTGRGELQARAAGRALAALGVELDLVLYSPKVRARATAELAAEECEEGSLRDCLEEYPPLAEGFDVADARAALRRAGPQARVMLVGHEPDLSGVIAALTGANVDLKKGGLACVRLEGSLGELVLLMRPRELALVADGGGLDSGLMRAVGSPGGG
jgi:phosphohistidine phosphatase